MERLVFGKRDKILLLGLKESPLLVTWKLKRPGALWGGRVDTRGGHMVLGRVLDRRCPQLFLSHKPRKIRPPEGEESFGLKISPHFLLFSRKDNSLPYSRGGRVTMYNPT